MSREILVYADWETITDGPKLMGILRSTESRGREIFSFNYNERWLARKDRLLLDPDLRFFEGDQYLNEERPNFGIFLDSAPDRWGRVLMQRREAARAIDEGRARRTLLESDYLLGVHDSQRLGGLRFKAEENGPFLDHQFPVVFAYQAGLQHSCAVPIETALPPQRPALLVKSNPVGR